MADDEAQRASCAPHASLRDARSRNTQSDELVERRTRFRELRQSIQQVSSLPIRPTSLTLLRADLQPRTVSHPARALKDGLEADLTPSIPLIRPHSSHARNPSPYARTHSRSKSSGSTWSNAPPMTRAHSSPIQTLSRDDSQLPLYPFNDLSSPHRSPTRVPSPLRGVVDDVVSTSAGSRSASWLEASSAIVVETIEEDSELELTPRSVSGPAVLIANVTPGRRSRSLRRRPASPLQSMMGLPISASYLTSGAELNSSRPSSPAASSLKYNESHPSLLNYASSSSFSSMPSTPTSQRSRSPSISSLDTIEDAPDLESLAVEAERIERLRIAAEQQERRDTVDQVAVRRRSSFDTSRGAGRISAREKKRWSVCGGERRGDLDLETIWED